MRSRLEMNRRIGSELGVQLVVDALKLAPANPSFLDVRDAILTALDHKRAGGQLDDRRHASAWQGTLDGIRPLWDGAEGEVVRREPLRNPGGLPGLPNRPSLVKSPSQGGRSGRKQSEPDDPRR